MANSFNFLRETPQNGQTQLNNKAFDHFLGLAPRGLKKTKVRLDLLTDIDVLLIVEKGIRGRIKVSYYSPICKS